MNQTSNDVDQKTHPVTGRDILSEARIVFFKRANQAIQAGEVTLQEVEIIYRPGTRKQNYWARHLRDLEEWIVEKKARNGR